MAYNLQSLITVLEQILNPEQTRWILDDHNKPQLQSLLQKAASLQQILEKPSLAKMEISLESQIRDAAHEAEDIIETYMVDHMLSGSQAMTNFTFCTPDLQQVTQQLDSAMEQVVVRLMQGNKKISSTSSAASFMPNPSWKNKALVGVDEDLLQLKDRLTGMQSKLEIVPIVGMGGIGKTTLARSLYQDPFIVYHFDVCSWSTISQDYDISAILSDLLGYKIGKDFDQHIELDNLYRSLYGKRYLIVLDDIWSTQAWDDIRRYFPDNNNGSRIVITTRESDVAKYADSQNLQHQVQLLSESASWNLLCEIVFGEGESCPDTLQGIGEKIASDCGGLPLAINLIGGLLSKLQRSEEVWEKIAEDVRGAIANSGEQFFSILSLSYDHLPNHLKPCFLYMGAFPEDSRIKASKLERLWVAEGFVKSSNNNKSLEEEAEGYLQALVDRNLVMFSDFYGSGKKRYNIHDLLRDVCITKAEDENFLHVLKKNAPDHLITFSNKRRVTVHTTYQFNDILNDSTELMSLARSFIVPQHVVDGIVSPAFLALRLLRVLDVMGIIVDEFPTQVFQLVNLRYLAIESYSEIPRGISRLWNLQTLIIGIMVGFLPPEIWEMSELRHLIFTGVIKIEDDEYMGNFVQKKMRTIGCVKLTSSLVRKGFFECIPNIRKISIYYDGELPLSAVVDLRHFHKLRKLVCVSDVERDGCTGYLSTLRFPCNLKKLTLHCCTIFAEVLTTLCALPYLEKLKVYNCIFESEDDSWEAAQGDEFGSLQLLHLSSLHLKCWRADETNFPRLRRLFMFECLKLEEIPSGIGEIPTLQSIELLRCSDSVVASAKQIQEEQQFDYGNYDLQLRIDGRLSF